jgi:uncharacterized protein YjbI with pentapeptide repeats
MSSTTPLPPPPPSPLQPPDPNAVQQKEKLDLEIKQLQQATSRFNRGLEFVKAWAPSLTTFVTLGALIWTINAGITQMRQTQNGQDQDRFDKAISRLGSNSVSERLTGASGLSLFLTTDQASRHAATLRFLGTALVIEKDANVRQAILDTFSHMNPAIVNQDAREDGLQTLLDLNRSAIRARLQQEEDIGHSLATKPQLSELQSQVNALRASAKAIVIFVKKGSSQHDLSGIDCTDCDFSSDSHPLDMSGSNFDHAVLTNATFAGTKLSGSSFDSAYLSGTSFEAAIMQRTHFTGAPHESYAVREYQVTGDRPRPPSFACADASNADFTGSLFFGVIESAISNERIAGFPDLYRTNLAGANLSRIGVYALPLTRSKAHSPFPKTKLITFQARTSKPKYGAMHVIESDDWRFETSSPSFERSWQFLKTQLQSAAGIDKAMLPAPLSLYRGAPPAMDDSESHRCDKYRSSQGQ